MFGASPPNSDELTCEAVSSRSPQGTKIAERCHEEQVLISVVFGSSPFTCCPPHLGALDAFARGTIFFSRPLVITRSRHKERRGKPIHHVLSLCRPTRMFGASPPNSDELTCEAVSSHSPQGTKIAEEYSSTLLLFLGLSRISFLWICLSLFSVSLCLCERCILWLFVTREDV